MPKTYRYRLFALLVSTLCLVGCNFFEPFAKGLNEDQEEVELFEAEDFLHEGDYPNAYERWNKLISKDPNNIDYRVKYGESLLGLLGINLLNVLHDLDASTRAGQTSSLLHVCPVGKDLVRMNEALEMIVQGPRTGDKGNAGIGYALMAGAKLLGSFDANGNRDIETGEVSASTASYSGVNPLASSTLWTLSTDYDKDGKSDQNGKLMGDQLEADLLASLINLEKAVTVSLNHEDAVATTDRNGTTIYVQKEFADAYAAIRTTYASVVSINDDIANKALAGSALATRIETLDN